MDSVVNFLTDLYDSTFSATSSGSMSGCNGSCCGGRSSTTPPTQQTTSARPQPTAEASSSQPAVAPLNSAEIQAILQQSWDHYRTNMIASDGRPLGDADSGDIDSDGNTTERVTFSEGVSYVLLRAVWIDDQQTFDQVLHWANDNMQRQNLGQLYHWNESRWITPPRQDNLFSWRYVPTLGQRDGGVIHYTYVPNEPWRGCFEVASDADLDIAAALIMANRRWDNESYLTEARAILNDIWNNLTGVVDGQRYLYGGDQFVNMGEVNPSYMRPAYFNNLFPAVDPAHDWQSLTTSSYRIIIESGDIELRDNNNNAFPGRVNLPSNWVDLSRTGALMDSDVYLAQGGQLFGWDAFRTLFWVAQDMAWNGNQTASRYLSDNTCSPADYGPYCFLRTQLHDTNRLTGGFNHDGTRVTANIPLARDLDQPQFGMYGAYLAFFHYAGDRESAQRVQQLLQSMYHQEGYWGNNPHDYYGQNWAWFGLALINSLPFERSAFQ